MPKHKSIYLFALETVLWLPFAFAAWYYAAPVLNAPVAWLLQTVLTNVLPQWIEEVESLGRLLEIITTIPVPVDTPVPPGQEPVFAFNANALKYSFGLPFLAALIFASPNGLGRKLRQVFLAWLLLLLPVQVFGLAGFVLKVLLYHTTPEISAQIAGDTWLREAIGLGYQFGTLILPAVTPLLIWVFLYRDYLQQLVPQFAVTPEPQAEPASTHENAS